VKFVVTGTGRSGTGFAAALFTAAGLPCGHEAVFREKPGLLDRGAPRKGAKARAKEPIGRLREDLRRRRTMLQGDASWMAAPRLRRFRGVSFLQLRHPLLVVRSFVGTRFFSDSTQHRAQRSFAAAYMQITGDDVFDAMRWWVVWNELGAAWATNVYRIEALDQQVFAGMLGLLNARAPIARAERAFAEVPSDVNSSQRRGDRAGNLNWSDLPSGKEKKDLEISARRFGYEIS